jgi:hypothetical protein
MQGPQPHRQCLDAFLPEIIDAPAGHSSIRSLLGAQGKLIVPKRDF